MQSRRDFLKSGVVLIVSFSAAFPLTAQGPFDTHPSHIDRKRLDSWLAVAADGSITAYTGKADLGQRMLTAQTQLVAEELCVPISRVKVIECDTAITPDQGTTSGSQSTPTNFNSKGLALAAATARESLLNLASQRLGSPAGLLTAADEAIADASGHGITYGELIGGRHFNLTVNPGAKRRTPDQWTVLGKPVPSLDRTALMGSSARSWQGVNCVDDTSSFSCLHSLPPRKRCPGAMPRPPPRSRTSSRGSRAARHPTIARVESAWHRTSPRPVRIPRMHSSSFRTTTAPDGDSARGQRRSSGREC